MGWKDPASEAYDRMRAREWERERARIWAQEMQRQQGAGSSASGGLGCLVFIPLVLIFLLIPLILISYFLASLPAVVLNMSGAIALGAIAFIWSYRRYRRVGPMAGFRPYLGPIIVAVIANLLLIDAFLDVIFPILSRQ